MRDAGPPFAPSAQGAVADRAQTDRAPGHSRRSGDVARKQPRPRRGSRRIRLLTALGAALVAVLVIAPGAGATLGVVGFQWYRYQSPEVEPGPELFTGVSGAAVNHNGTGGTSPGDYYVLGGGKIERYSHSGEYKEGFEAAGTHLEVDQATGDLYTSSGNAINVYTPTGGFIRKFGYDVVKEGPDDSSVNAVQKLTVAATGGTFALTTHISNNGPPITVLSPPIPFNASAAVVQTAAEELFANTNKDETVTVTGGPGDAIGSSPYYIEFTGASGGDAIDFYTELGGSAASLTGATRVANMETLIKGGAPEICKPGDVCQSVFSNSGVGGAFSEIRSFSFAPSAAPNAGNLIIMENNRVSEATPTGHFVRALGWDVVAKGPDNSSADEQQQLTVRGDGGRFSLSFRREQFSPEETTGASGSGDLEAGSTTVSNVITTNGSFEVGEVITASGIPAGTTIEAVGVGTLTLSQAATSTVAGRSLTGNDLPYNASPAEVKAALEALPLVGGVGGEVEVTGGPGDLTGSAPYTITFKGTLGGDNIPQLSSNTSGLTISSGSKAASVSTVADGGAFETCNAAAGDVCQQNFERGWELGKFRYGANSAAEDSTGAIYVSDGAGPELGNSNRRVLKFTPSGATFTPSIFGTNEVQKVTVAASAGQFRLQFGYQNNGAQVIGDAVEGSNKITNVLPVLGEFAVGQPVSSNSTPVFPGGTVITAVEPGTITLSRPAQENRTEGTFYSNSPYWTGDLPYNATAAEVEAALDALPSIGSLPPSPHGSVSVTGGPGDATGSSPYVISFDGGVLQDNGVNQMRARNGTTALSGGSGPGANDATVVTETQGGPGAAEPRTGPRAILIDNADHVFVLRRFAPNDSTCFDGLPSVLESRVEQFNTNGEFEDISAPCLEIDGETGGEGGESNFLTIDPFNGELYYAKQQGNNGSQKFLVPEQSYPGGNQVFIWGELGEVPTLSLNAPSNLKTTSVTLSGEINPHGPPLAANHPHPTEVKYRVELKEHESSNWEVYAPDTPIGSTGNSPVPFNVGISELTPKTTYDLRVVAEKVGLEPVVGETQTVTTLPAPPRIDSLSSSNITATAADLHAVINPLGEDTSVHFEYGKSALFGQSTEDEDIGSALGQVAVEQHIENLDQTIYYFRVVATNAAGTTISTSQTFSFYPEPCPNSAARQQTGSGGLPDCRAYELVSPGNARGVTMSAGGVNSPYASPSRLAFQGYFGVLPGPWNPPNGLGGDNYISTRTSTGWKTSYVGIPATTRTYAGAAPLGKLETWGHRFVDLNMDRLLEFDRGHPPNLLIAGPIGGPTWGSDAPYVYSTDEGKYLGRWPTNAGEVEGALLDQSQGGFAGAMMPSGDFSHYFFSSADVAFAPGGLTSEGGSVYDDDTETGSVTVASKLANGSPIPREPGDHSNDFKELPAASADGSHILIAATGTGICGEAECEPTQPAAHICGWFSKDYWGTACPGNLPAHLYMRVDGTITYDVSDGAVVHFVGMTKDGGKVFFTSDEQLVDDHDQSTDLYMWEEATDSVKRISDGEGTVGDTDACGALWIHRCSIETIELGGGSFGSNLPEFSEDPAREAPTTDNSIAAESGDIYFYSPEQFDPTKGIPGRRNLYVYRNGEVQFVATLQGENPLKRIQVSPDGKHAAFLTASPLTSYDNTAPDGVCSRDGLNPGSPATSGPRCLEMYSYETETHDLRCVSCPSDLAPPTRNVQGSQDGLFMSNDGRTFFATNQSLVPQDGNGITDVYEYVAGRPRLISSGTAATFRGPLFGEAGLVGVSADGVDVYFATYEGLVAEDHNGQFGRFYDARTNGGFATETAAAPCAAAEECRGTGSSAPTLANVTSTAVLGRDGNVKQARHHRKKKRTHRRHRKRRHHARSTRHKHAHREARHARHGG